MVLGATYILRIIRISIMIFSGRKNIINFLSFIFLACLLDDASLASSLARCGPNSSQILDLFRIATRKDFI
jgi:hypothetical protein